MSVRKWEKRYTRRLLSTDLIVIVAAVFGAQWLRFGTDAAELAITPLNRAEVALTYSLVSAILVVTWYALLGVVDSRDPKIYGAGASEYKRVANATFITFGGYAIIAFLTKAEIGRGYLLIALPAGLFLLLLNRWIWRKRLHRQRRHNRNQYRTLIVGDFQKSQHVAAELERSNFAGFRLVGAVTSAPASKELLPDVPIVADEAGLLDAVDEHGAHVVVITGSDAIDPLLLRQVGWELESRNVDLIVSAALTDVAGPRIHMRPVANLPLIHVDYPRFVGYKQFVKRMFDLFVSATLLIFLSPALLILSTVVRLSSPGPVFFKQERIGLGGKPFMMWKFRSMTVDAEAQLQQLSNHSDGNSVLFKMKNDPRVTAAGRFLRKYSLDELPQLFNVLLGTMSLVGPRPQLPSEVAAYEKWVHRRLLVKPGITGLWQVSGRSDLSWEDSVRLDLYYVENWSLAGDMILLLRTAKTVIRADGAY